MFILGNLKLAEEAFRIARITDELSTSSITKYRDSVKKFSSVMGSKKFDDLTLKDFDDFIILMKAGGAENARIANVISGVKWVIAKLQREALISNNIDLDRIKKPKIGHKEQTYLTPEEIEMFVGAILGDMEKNGQIIRTVRFMALIKLLLQTGCRIGEALSINTSDIDWRNGEIPIIGKGKKPRKLSLRKDTILWLKKYIAVRKSEHEALFVTLKGKSRWQQTDTGRSFRRYRKISGINKYFSIHTIRRTTATLLFHQGIGPEKVQLILGHTQLETTVKYYLKSAQEQVVKNIMMEDRYFNFIPQSAISS